MRYQVILVLVLLALPRAGQGEPYTLTFDDSVNYASTYGALFDGSWEISANTRRYPWGSPHSGTWFLVWDWYPGSTEGMIKFAYGFPGVLRPYSIYSLGAYYSTAMGTVIELTGYYHSDDNPVASVTIGAPDESWSNRYVELYSPPGTITYVLYHAISSVDALRQFSADDMTVVPVPEPSSLLALGVGAAGLVGMMRRRRC